MFFNVLIFGCGNIGSRHLQGLIKNDNVKIFVVENNIQSIEITKERISKFKNKNLVNFYKDLNFKKKKFDLCIIATTSKNRLLYIKKIISSKIIKNLIIEKVAFQNINDFLKAKEILNKKNISTYINCPRRSYKLYRDIKKIINNKILIKISVTGNPWNMASNMLHFIDLYLFFAGRISEKQKFKLSKINKITQSKRNGFKELKGKIYVYNSNGCILEFKDLESLNQQLIIKIYNGKKIIEVNESKFTIKLNRKKKNNFKYPYQSYLSQFYPTHLIKSKKLNLTKLSEAYLGHKLLFKILSIQFKKIYNKKFSSFPIS